MANEVEQNTFGNIEVKYNRPKFVHRLLANLIDLIIYVIVFIGLFILTRFIFAQTPNYKLVINKVDSLRLESGMYYKNSSGDIVDIVTYMNSSNIMTNEAKVKFSENRIAEFFAFEKEHISNKRYEQIVSNYDERRLNKTFTENEVTYHLFILNESEEIIKNPELFENGYKYLYRDFYIRQIDKYFQGYFTSTPIYYDAVKKLSNYLIWGEVPIAYVSSVILVYYVPTLFFRRGRKTLGKALYRIGSVDDRFLSPTFARNTAKWSLFLLEMILGLASAGLIFILSFTMMVFSKNKQGFPDYVLGIQEVDVSNNKIYFTYEEIELNNIERHKKPTDFRLIDRP